MPKLSIIVPIYNVERYFRECAESLVNQSEKDIEIIFIDDGSPDNCPAICDEYQKKYPDIVKVLHQENQGQNIAWNNGISIATGEWICFVDSDDWVELNMAEIMLNYAEQNPADIHVFSHSREYKNKKKYIRLKNHTLTDKEKANYLYNYYEFPVEAWSRIYRRSFIEKFGLRFYNGDFQNEDNIFNLYAFHYANKVCTHEEIFYHYRMLNSSFMKKWNPERINVYQKFFDRYAEFTDKHFVADESKLMKQKMAIEVYVYWFFDYFNDKRNGFPKKEKIKKLKEHFKKEPFKLAISEYPRKNLRLVQRISIYLLKKDRIRLWMNLLSINYKFKMIFGKTGELYD